MGNEQSAPTPRRPTNKLSKPRTNTHSNTVPGRGASAPASRRNSVSTSASPTKTRYSIIPADTLGDEEMRKEVAPRKRMSLFRSKSAKPQARTQIQEEVTVDEEVAVIPSVEQSSHRWSREPRQRGDSFTTQSSAEPSYEHQSWTGELRSSAYSLSTQSSRYSEPPGGLTKPPVRHRMSLQTYTHHPRLSLVAELPSPTPETKRRSRYEDEPQNLTQASRANSESNLYAPIRRRSLLQHGVATRMSFAESDPRSSLPSQTQTPESTPPRELPAQGLPDEVRDYYYNPTKPTSSPLSNLVLLGPNAAFKDIGPRTETPTQLEHIGAFKLGSLRITNGAASPIPSIRSEGDDYVSAGNARISEELYRQNHRSHTLSVPAEVRQTPWVVRTESPLRQTHGLEHKPLTIETHIPVDPAFAFFDFQGSQQVPVTESPSKALDLAKEYQQDLASSPFSFDNSPLPSPRLDGGKSLPSPRLENRRSPLPSPRLESTSKHTAIEDDLFEAEPTTPDLSTRMPRSFDSAYDNGVAQPRRVLKGPRDQPPKPLAKADSGYSSNVSLRSFKRDSTKLEEIPPTPAPEPVSRVPSSTYSAATEKSRMPSSTYSVASADSDLTLRMKRSLPSLPSTEWTPSPPMRRAPPVPRTLTFNYDKEVPNPPTPDKDTTPSHLSVPKNASRQSATLNRNSKEGSPATSDISTSSSSSRLSKSKINKRPQSVQPVKTPEPFTIQAFRSPSEQLRIPPPPIEIRKQLEQRENGFPVASFANTYHGHVALRHSSSKETLGTIFSVGSAEVRDELNFARLQSALPPVPVEPSIPENPAPFIRPDYHRRNTVQVTRAAPTSVEMVQKQSRWGRKSFQASRDRSLPRVPIAIPNKDLEQHLTSYSIVESSLGKSPYELAADTIPKPKVVNERAKSMTAQFEADAATRFNIARANSQTKDHSGPILRMRSYDSIAAGIPTPAGNSSRRSSREHPPKTHENNTPWRPHSTPAHQQQMQLPQSQSPLTAHPPQSYTHERQSRPETFDERQTIASKSKSKSPPPVSMTTQRKVLPAAIGAVLPTAAEIQANEWANTAKAWKSNRQSAGSVLQSSEVRGRKSTELRTERPQSSHAPPQPRPSQELRTYGSYDTSQPQGRNIGNKSWNVGVGYEDAHAYPSPPRKPVRSWTDGPSMHERENQEYNHSYGTSHSNKENFPDHPSQQEQEFYSEETVDDSQISEQIHQRSTSTSSMLILDRFSGGLGYGYEPGMGLVGSAGTRNVGRMEPKGGHKAKGRGVVAEKWGVDLSDVPVFLQRVEVEG